jgi:hypothetical protein
MDMQNRIVRSAAALLLATLMSGAGTGCFVFDELDAGKEMFSPPKPAKGKKADGNGGGGFSQMLENGAETFGEVKVKVAEAMKPEPDPDNTIIRCEVEGRTQFTRKHDCMVAGGIVMR